MTPATKTISWIIGIIVVAIGAYMYLSRDGGMLDGNATSTDNGNVVACTMDAKMCPDGSYVGRTGPNCEFTACPTTSTNGASNTNTVNASVDVVYPADWAK